MSASVHSLKDLPTEILSLILEKLDDVLDFISVATTCKKLQGVVKTLVVSTGDSPEQHSTFKHITSEYVHIDATDDNVLSHYKPKLRKYRHFIFEYSYHDGKHIGKYTEIINRVKSFRSSRITELILNKDATRQTLTIHNVSDIRMSTTHYIYDVIRTIYLNGADQGLLEQGAYTGNEKIYESLVVLG
jgi:hypothetical protein